MNFSFKLLIAFLLLPLCTNTLPAAMQKTYPIECSDNVLITDVSHEIISQSSLLPQEESLYSRIIKVPYPSIIISILFDFMDFYTTYSNEEAMRRDIYKSLVFDERITPEIMPTLIEALRYLKIPWLEDIICPPHIFNLTLVTLDDFATPVKSSYNQWIRAKVYDFNQDDFFIAKNIFDYINAYRCILPLIFQHRHSRNKSHQDLVDVIYDALINKLRDEYYCLIIFKHVGTSEQIAGVIAKKQK